MTNGTLRRAGVGALSALLALFGLVIPLAGSAGAQTGFQCSRLAGEDRYATAAAIATSTFSSGTDTVLLATGERFPDALAGNYTAGNRNAPILLTTRDDLPTSTEQAMDTLFGTRTTRNVVLLGREEAISTAVENELRADGHTVTRIGGTDRYETAAQLATASGQTVGSIDNQRTAIIATGSRFPDALSAGPGAYAANLPVLLTPGADEGSAGTTLHPSARSALQSLQIQHVIITGGDQAVSPQTEQEIRAARGSTTTIATTRLGGAERTETARLISEYYLQKLAFDESHVNVARGDDFPDALAGGPHGGEELAPILLTVSPTTLSPEGSGLGSGLRRYLQEHSDALTDCDIFGGEQAVSSGVENEIEQLGQGTGGDVDVSTSATDVEPGGEFTITVEGEGIEDVTVSGDCIDTQTFTPDDDEGTDTDDDSFDFTVQVNNDAEAGECEITVVTDFTDANRANETDTLDINITEQAGNATVTDRPELVNAEIVDTVTQEEIDASDSDNLEDEDLGTTVRFCFDEEITGGPVLAENFRVYDADGTRFDGEAGSAEIEDDEQCVTVLFPEVDQEEEAENLTVAAANEDAVTDDEGDTNPIGDAPLGEDRDETVGAAGVTDAPDLQTIGGFTSPTTDNAATIGVDERTLTLVTFTFDEDAVTENPANFFLITTDGEVIECTAVSGEAGGNFATAADEEDADNTIQVACEEAGENITADQIARGVVETGAVREPDPDEVGDAEENPQQATEGAQGTDTQDDSTDTPDLVSATFNPADEETDEFDEVVFTFDESVFVLDADGNPVAAGTRVDLDPANGAFCVFDVNGDETCAEEAQRGPNTNQVTAFFTNDSADPAINNDAVDEAVGAFVEEGSVEGASGDVDRFNLDDEEGVENEQVTTITAGRTAGPDLVDVDVVERTGGPVVVFTFDEEITETGAGIEGDVEEGNFAIFLADGTRLECTDVTTGQDTAATTDDNTVTCTDFDVDIEEGGAATNAQIRSAVLGTVEEETVSDESGTENPKGAEVISEDPAA